MTHRYMPRPVAGVEVSTTRAIRLWGAALPRTSTHRMPENLADLGPFILLLNTH